MELFAWIEQIAIFLVGVAAGGPVVVAVVNKIKEVAGLSGTPALILSVVASALMALAVMVVEGQLNPEALAVENFATLALAFVALAQTWYLKFKGEEEAE